jgi:hypothetical protein
MGVDADAAAEQACNGGKLPWWEGVRRVVRVRLLMLLLEGVIDECGEDGDHRWSCCAGWWVLVGRWLVVDCLGPDHATHAGSVERGSSCIQCGGR